MITQFDRLIATNEGIPSYLDLDAEDAAIYKDVMKAIGESIEEKKDDVRRAIQREPRGLEFMSAHPELWVLTIDDIFSIWQKIHASRIAEEEVKSMFPHGGDPNDIELYRESVLADIDDDMLAYYPYQLDEFGRYLNQFRISTLSMEDPYAYFGGESGYCEQIANISDSPQVNVIDCLTNPDAYVVSPDFYHCQAKTFEVGLPIDQSMAQFIQEVAYW